MYKKLSRVLAMLLSVAMVLSLAACGGGKATPDKESTSSASNESEAQANTAAGETTAKDTVASGDAATAGDTITADEILSRDFSDPITVSFAGIQVTDGLDYNHGNDYYSWWTDTFNVTWDVTSLTWDNWVERLNTWINADDLPDWSVWNFNAGDAQNYVDQGLVKKMPDDWKEKYPNLARAAKYCEANAYYEDLYGGMYYFFRPAFASNFPADIITNHISIFMRTDFAQQAGYDLSKNIESGTITISEFMDYLRAVKAAGICEYPWYNTSQYVGNLLDRCTEASGVLQNAFYKGSDGQYHWGPGEAETGIKDTLKVIKQAYDDGLLYPEFYTLQDPDDIGHFYAAGDTAAVMYTGMAAWFDRFDNYMKENLGVSYWDTSVTLVLTDDKGIAYDDPNMNFWACNILSPNIDDETLDRILTIWDYGCTEEGQLRIRLGIPGVDWDYDENGDIVNLLADTEWGSADVKYTSTYPITGNMFILSDDYSFINPSFTKEARDRVAELYNIRAQVTSIKDESIDWDLGSYSSQALNLASMTYYDEYANLITKAGDFETNYDQWVADKLKMVQPVLDDLNEKFGK